MTAVVALTFDNGPTPGVTDRVLDVLDARAVPATFFAIGERLATPDGRVLGAEVVARGHALGGHTWSHAVPFGVGDDATVDRELHDTAAVVGEVGGDARLFRPFGLGGVIDDRLMSAHGARLLCDGGFTCSLWTSVPRDWEDVTGWPARALADMAAAPHAVVVLHDVAAAALERLDDFLARGLDGGAHFTRSLPDVCTPIRFGRPTLSYGLLGVGSAALDVTDAGSPSDPHEQGRS